MKNSAIRNLLTICLFLCFAASGYSIPKLPNVIFILADDLGYGDLSCYGQDKMQTPNIDRLSSEGLRFINHYSGNTVCSPSRASLMTGQHSGHVYLRGNIGGELHCELDPEMKVLAEVFKEAGYATGAYGKWGMGQTLGGGATSPLTHGFDEFYGWKSQTIAHTYFPSSIIYNEREIPLQPGTYIHDAIMERALGFIERNAVADQPFFCYIPTAIPHAAMHAPKELHEKWRKVFPQFDNKIGEYKAGEETCPDVINPIAGFAAMIERLDTHVGAILDRLKALGIDENTIVMFSSDNGAHHEGGHEPDFWNSTGSLRGGKRDMHEGGIRVPMLARWPGTISAGTTTDHISAFWDLLPTVCELTKQPVPEQADGLSFLPTLVGKTRQQKNHPFMYWEFTKWVPKNLDNPQEIFSRAVRKGNWKAYFETGKAMEIFDLNADPFEKNDLAAEHPEIVEQMLKMMEAAHTPPPKFDN
jgi:arylsulfatase A-like enzyme